MFRLFNSFLFWTTSKFRFNPKSMKWKLLVKPLLLMPFRELHKVIYVSCFNHFKHFFDDSATFDKVNSFSELAAEITTDPHKWSSCSKYSFISIISKKFTTFSFSKYTKLFSIVVNEKTFETYPITIFLDMLMQKAYIFVLH